jgi:hypothetical protein
MDLSERQDYEWELSKQLKDFQLEVISQTVKAEGSEGTRCEIPRMGSVRPECLEGLCCGSARKEGTIIESCQKADSTTYVYEDHYGNTEEWDFKCIKGAQSLFISIISVVAYAYILI